MRCTMAVGIKFERERAAYLLDCLANGRPIEGVRTVDDFLALAGACVFAAFSHGPALKGDIDWSMVPSEYREAEDEDLFADIHAALDVYGRLTMLVCDGEYDANYAPVARAVVCSDGERRVVVPIEGFPPTTRG